MKALKVIIVIILVIGAIFLVGALFMPKQLNIEKTMTMKAHPEVIYEQVSCFKNWNNWSPWLDSLMVNSYSGPDCGLGAVNSWEHEKMGNGKQSVIEADENKMIKTELIFGEQKPAYSNWYFEPSEDGGTNVIWTFSSELSYPVWRWIGILFMKPGIEKSYEKGLIALNDFTKDMKPKPKFRTGEIVEKEVKPQFALTFQSKVTIDQIGPKMEESFRLIIKTITEKKLQLAGSPFAIWHEWNPDGESVMECAMPIAKPGKFFGDVKQIKTYGGKVITATHYGQYETTEATWN
ncbi:MAG: SRPBCC family protein, partial [Bacteroidales bacterium]|nr:SRPBCC family protein [Bacteroidales bacterium]